MQKTKEMRKRIVASLVFTALPFLGGLVMLIHSGFPLPYKISFCFMACVLYSSFLGCFAGNRPSRERSGRHD